MRIVVRAAGLAALMGLAACASDSEDIEIAQRAQTQLVGMPKAALLSCAGTPTRQAVVDGIEYYTYSVRPDYDGANASLGLVEPSADGVGYGLDIGVPAFSSRRTQGCDTTFILRGGAVQQVTYPAGANATDCGALVSSCLAR